LLSSKAGAKVLLFFEPTKFFLTFFAKNMFFPLKMTLFLKKSTKFSFVFAHLTFFLYLCNRFF